MPLIGPRGSGNPGAPFDDWTGSNEEEQRANANLIAASPELLAALTTILAGVEEELNPSGAFMRSAADKARAAILKATGGAQ